MDMQSFSRENHGARYLLTVIDVFSKYAWVMPLKEKTGVKVTEAFQKIITQSKRHPGKLWVDKGTEFYNRTFQKFLKENQIEMYSTFNEGKAVVVERFNRTLKTRMWKYFSANSTRRYFDVLPDLLKQYNSNVHRSIKMTPIEASMKKNEQQVKKNLYPDQTPTSSRPRFSVGDRVRIVKHKRLFQKGYLPAWSEEVFVIDQILPTTPHTYRLVDLDEEDIRGSFYEQELQKTTVQAGDDEELFRIEKIIRKDYKKKRALVKWKGYPSKFNSWVPLADLQRL